MNSTVFYNKVFLLLVGLIHKPSDAVVLMVLNFLPALCKQYLPAFILYPDKNMLSSANYLQQSFNSFRASQDDDDDTLGKLR